MPTSISCSRCYALLSTNDTVITVSLQKVLRLSSSCIQPFPFTLTRHYCQSCYEVKIQCEPLASALLPV